MSEIILTLPDKSEKKVTSGTTPLQVAEEIGPRLAKAAVGAKVNGEVVKDSVALKDFDTIELGPFKFQFYQKEVKPH